MYYTSIYFTYRIVYQKQSNQTVLIVHNTVNIYNRKELEEEGFNSSLEYSNYVFLNIKLESKLGNKIFFFDDVLKVLRDSFALIRALVLGEYSQ